MKKYPTKPSIYIPYFDMNNLYGCGMSDYLSYGGFKWLKYVDNFDVNLISEKCPIGYILEVDRKYPDELHSLHNDYSLAPEKLPIFYDISDYCQKNTDSRTYEIKSEDVYEEYFKQKHLFDFSNYSKDSKFFDLTDIKVIGKIKDMSEEKIIDEFLGLNWKMYSVKNIEGKESNTAKGVNIATEFNEFKDTLFNKKVLRHRMKRIQSKNIRKSKNYHYFVLMIKDLF